MNTIHTARVDLVNYGATIRLHAMQGDQYSRKVSIHLTAGGVFWRVPDNSNVLIHYERKDGTSGEYDALPDGSSAFSIDGNIVTITLAPQMLSTADTINMAVSIIRGQEILTTFPMMLYVHDLPDSEDPDTGESYFSITGFLPQPAGDAKVGQMFKVKEVSEDGKILAVEAFDLDSLPAGGTEGQTLVKTSNEDGAAQWQDPPDRERVEKLESQVADLLYKPVAISAFTNNVNVAEMGSSVSAVTLYWYLNKTPTSLSLDGVAIDKGLTQLQLAGQNITANKTWTLKATDERNAEASKTTTVHFYNGVYYGAAEHPETDYNAAILALTKILTATRKRSFTVTAGTGQYIWYVLPARLGECTFKVGGFEGGFEMLGTIDFSNASGYTESYRIYRSANAGLGNTTVEVS